MTAGAAVQPPAGERTRERLAFWAYRAGETAIGALPRGVVLPVAAAAGNLAYDLAGDKQDVVRANLARALGLPPDHPKVHRAARRAFRNYARYLADVMRLADETPDDIGGPSSTWTTSRSCGRPAPTRRACCCAPCTWAAWTSSHRR